MKWEVSWSVSRPGRCRDAPDIMEQPSFSGPRYLLDHLRELGEGDVVLPWLSSFLWTHSSSGDAGERLSHSSGTVERPQG